MLVGAVIDECCSNFIAPNSGRYQPPGIVRVMMDAPPLLSIGAHWWMC
jgi:hypothetical protein